MTALTRLERTLRSFFLGPFGSGDKALSQLFGSRPVTSGVSVDEISALNFSAVWRAVSLISSQLGQLPLKHYRTRSSGRGKDRLADSPIELLFNRAPNPEMTAMILRETLIAHVLLWGNGYAEIVRDGAGRPAELWPITPDRVEPFRDERDRLRYRIYLGTSVQVGITSLVPRNSEQIILRPDEILHIPGLSFDGTVGFSPIRMARESIGLGIAAERFGGSFFGGGSTFGGILSHPKALSKDGADWLRAEIESKHQGPDRAHRFLLLQEGMSYTKLGVDPDSAQFLETRQFQIQEVARWFGIPPHKLGDMSRATFSNIESQALEFITDALLPWARRIEQEINRKLVRQPSQFVEHLFEGLLRGDTKSRFDAYAVARNWGWMSADDVRERENLNPLPDGQGEIYLVPANMTDAAKLLETEDPAEMEAMQQQLQLLQAENQNLQGAQADAETEDAGRALQLRIVHRDLIVDAVGRILRRETERLRRHAATPAKLRVWADTYYDDERETMEQILLVPVRAALVALGRDDDAAEVTREIVTRYIDKSRVKLQEVLDAQPENLMQALDPMLRQWEQQRPRDIADSVMENGHVERRTDPASEARVA